MILNPINERFQVVPVLNFNVYRIRIESPKSNAEITQTELQGYYTTPDEMIKGSTGRKFTFLEAINRFTI